VLQISDFAAWLSITISLPSYNTWSGIIAGGNRMQFAVKPSVATGALTNLAGQERLVPLQYFLSEMMLFEIRFPMVRYSAHFTQFDGELHRWPDLLDSLPGHIRGLWVPSHPIQGPIPVVTRLGHILRYAPQQFYRHYTEIGGSFEDYFSNFGASSRREFRRQASRYANLCGGEIPIREYRRPEEMEEFYRHARTVSARSYQETLDGGFPKSDTMVDCLRDLAQRDANRGYILFHGERPVAYHYLRHNNGILSEPVYGYDMEYRKWGVGAVLQFRLLEQWFAQGCYRMLDHGEGQDYHQVVFATGKVMCANLYFFRRTVRASAAVHLHRAVEATSRTTGRILQAMHIKDAVKKLLWHKY